MTRRSPKVFGIGFHKTGTTSLARALTLLGYRVTGPNGVNDPKIAENVYDLAYREAERHDAVQDNPWPLLYKELDQWFPGSKFVLTVRPTDEWIRSQVRHFKTATTPMRTWIYGVGCPEGNEKIYTERYERHYRDVLTYFRDRPDDLLILDITAGEGWEKLCPFLDLPIPAQDFPSANKATERERFSLRRWARKALGRQR